MKQTRQPVCAIKQSIYLDVYGRNVKNISCCVANNSFNKAECRCAECRDTECRGTLLETKMLSLSWVAVVVMAPIKSMEKWTPRRAWNEMKWNSSKLPKKHFFSTNFLFFIFGLLKSGRHSRQTAELFGRWRGY
jgi:hypothetical protein